VVAAFRCTKFATALARAGWLDVIMHMFKYALLQSIQLFVY